MPFVARQFAVMPDSQEKTLSLYVGAYRFSGRRREVYEEIKKYLENTGDAVSIKELMRQYGSPRDAY